MSSSGAIPFGNVPQQSTSFIGRKREMAEIKRLLSTTRLLTLTGSGGCGKTRLAVQLALQVARHHQHEAWFVDLASLSDPALLPLAVASALGVREQPGRSVLETLTSHLQSRKMLLVLDNCEHLLKACASLVALLLSSCPDLQVLATSRQSLGMAEELSWRVPSLSIPGGDSQINPKNLSQYEAVQLFMERAGARRSNLAITPANAHAIAQLCVRLDGIPLAIELAAARISVLSIEEVVARLEERFRLLVRGNQEALPRQQTLLATMNWSYNLLSEAEQAMLRSLAVFTGGFSLEAAQAIWGGEIDEYETIDLLSQLVDQSLVNMVENNARSRYSLLETVRQYAWEKLQASGEMDELRDRHLNWCMQLAEGAETGLQGPNQTVWLDRLQLEQGNVRSALDWSATGHGSRETGLRLAGALHYFWSATGHLSEGLTELIRLLSTNANNAGQIREPGIEEGSTGDRAYNAAGTTGYDEYAELLEPVKYTEQVKSPGDTAYSGYTEARARALLGAGHLSWLLADYESAASFLQKSLQMYQTLGNKRGIANSLHILGNVALYHGDDESALALYQESLAIRRELGDKWGIAQSLNNMTLVSDLDSATRMLEESLTLFRELGDTRGSTYSLSNLANLARRRGDYIAAYRFAAESLAIHRAMEDKGSLGSSLVQLGGLAVRLGYYSSAHRLLQEALAIHRETGERVGFAECFEEMARLAGALGLGQRAVRLWGAARGLRDTIGAPQRSDDQIDIEGDLAALRVQLGDVAFNRAWIEGTVMTFEQAITFAAHQPPGISGIVEQTPEDVIGIAIARGTSGAPEESMVNPHELTKREVEVLRLVATGMSNVQVAEHLSLSQRTVEAHMHSIFNKLDLVTRGEAIRFAVDHRIV